MSGNLIDMIERFQTHHALQEEREIKNFRASGNGAAALGVPDESGTPYNSIFETERVRVSTVAVAGSTEWSSPHDGRDRLVVTLGKIAQLLPRDSDLAFPARCTWIPANSDCKVPNETDQTTNLMIVEFNDVDRGRPSLTRLTE